jgi:uncharacterized damage-inducible protein DinB
MTIEKDLRFPIGPDVEPTHTTPAERAERIAAIGALPAELRAAVEKLSDKQIDTPYRPGGWTVRQLVHHIADSHANGYVRLKLAMTEQNPTIKPYAEDRWAELADSKLPIELSLQMVDSIHARWAAVLRSLKESDFACTYQHPERGSLTLEVALASYVWHGKHHVAHITELRKREGW